MVPQVFSLCYLVNNEQRISEAKRVIEF